LWPEARDISLSVEPRGLIFRIARRPDPWQPPDWSLASADGTFGNRFDDPDGIYRVLYASSQRLGCFLETLARFRIDLTLYAELAAIEGEDDFVPLGHVPVALTETRLLGSAEHQGHYADLYGSEWVGRLRRELAADCTALGIGELDAGTLQLAAPRRLTQIASRKIFQLGFDGIVYRSRFGHDIENWALFEPFKINPKSATAIELNDPDLRKALAIHHLTFDLPQPKSQELR
jgi:RES domain